MDYKYYTVLGYPVTLECGDNFCRSCITQSWEGIATNFSCPQCKKTSQKTSLRANEQMENITQIMKKFCPKKERQKGGNLCEEHEENFKLLNDEDKKMIDDCSSESQNHRSHTVMPIEEAAQLYKNKFKMCLEPLRKNLEDLVKFKSHEEKKAEELMNEIQIKRQKLVSEFEELHQFLNKEKQILLSKLEEKKMMILQRIRENVTQLEEQCSSLMQLILEIETKTQQPFAELLKDVKDTLRRYQNMEFPEPKAVCTDLKMGFQLRYPEQLKKLITKFGESPQTSTVNVSILNKKDIQISPVVQSQIPVEHPASEQLVPMTRTLIPAPNATLTKETLQPQLGGKILLVVTPSIPTVNQKVPQCLPQHLQTNVQAQVAAIKSTPLVPQLITLRCYPSELWMEYGRYAVDVTLDPETAHPWLILSADRKNVRCGDRKQDVPDSSQRFDYSLCVLGFEGLTSGRHYWEVEVGELTVWELGVCKDSVSRKGRITLAPEQGYWVMRLKHGDEYRALTSPVTRLHLNARPQTVGILLDYQAGKVSFFNANTSTHLYTFIDTFKWKLQPFFCPGYNYGTLRIREVRNSD
uniref:Pyrin isoform X2 n=1 Tax=Geotrypetes seraphini TaxID=260995 RepID=A0A6P8RJA5_GEOSA|nr:pyrin isoform X2 [Geotrypetes seraphini]